MSKRGSFACCLVFALAFTCRPACGQLRGEPARSSDSAAAAVPSAGSAQGVLSQAPAQTPRLIEFEVLIAEQVADGKSNKTLDLSQSSNKIITNVKELEEQGKLDILFRARLSTVSEQIAMLQVGEEKAVETGRVNLAQRGGGGVQRGASSFNFRQVGTLVQLTPRIIDNDTVLVEINVERSRIVPAPPRGEEAGPVPDGTSTFTAQTTVRIPNGETVVVVASARDDDRDGKERLAVLVKANLEPVATSPATTTKAEPAREIKIFFLQFAKASDVGRVLQTLFADHEFTLAVDERLNNVVVTGEAPLLKQIEALLLRLDDAPNAKR